MNKKAFTLIESLISVVILAIGFAGVYALVSASSKVLHDSIDRERMDFISTEVMETLHSDVSQIMAYKFSNLDSANCNAIALESPNDGGEEQLNKLKNWCKKLINRVGARGQGGNVRKINITSRDTETGMVYVVSIDFSVDDDKKTVFMKKVFNVPNPE